MGYLTPEGKVKRSVTTLLKEHGVWYFFPANNGFGKAGIPDIIAIMKGTFVGIEVKADATKKPTALQIKCGEEIQRAGGLWLVVCDKSSLELLETIIREQLYR
jgi:hypothetical protein